MPADLRSLIEAIPIASDGHVITEDYHNTVRAAIVELERRVGMGGGVQGGTFSFSPTINVLPNQGSAWMVNLGYSTKSADQDAIGWFGLTLPDGVRIRRFAVLGEVTGTNVGSGGSLDIRLQRQAVTARNAETIVTIPVPFSIGAYQVTRDAPSTNVVIVNNTTHKYLVRVEQLGASPPTGATLDALVSIYAFQVICDAT